MKKNIEKIIAILMVIAGIIIAVKAIEIFIKVFIPVVLVLLVLKIVFSSPFKKNNALNIKRSSAIFSGSQLNFDGQEFSGGKFFAIFGGVECDLSTALIDDNCVIDATAIFGGVDLIVPEYINVQVNSVSLFGGVSKANKNILSDAKTIHINTLAIFGGVDIK